MTEAGWFPIGRACMATVMNGKDVAKKFKDKIKEDVAAFTRATKMVPGLATVLVGEDAASRVYVNNKIKSTEACGMKSIHHQLEADISQDYLVGLIKELNTDKEIHGILVQLPLPKHINPFAIIHTIDPQKDVDGFHPENLGLLAAGADCLEPCTPQGVIELLKEYDIPIVGRDVLIIGRSNIVGKPLALMMIREHATVCVAHSRTKNLPAKVRNADILVAAVGQARFVKGDWLDHGVVVIDVGINRGRDGKLCGDVDFETARERASYITPVPGGVGPMTIAMLMRNTLKAARKITGAGVLNPNTES